MEQFAFISRHEPTNEQINMALDMDIRLFHVGDYDGFIVRPETFREEEGNFDGVIVVHAGTALNLISEYTVGVFENELRAVEGEKPTFSAKKLHIWRKK